MKTSQPISNPAQTELFIKMVVDAWDVQNSRVKKLIDSLTDEQLAAEVSGGRNSGTYLLGHLTAVSDNMLPLLGFSERFYPELDNIYLKNPDKSGLERPDTVALRKYWSKVGQALTEHIAKTKPEEWFNRHTAVTEEAFEKEPHRNKLNLLINRTNHMAYHFGQLIFLQNA